MAVREVSAMPVQQDEPHAPAAHRAYSRMARRRHGRHSGLGSGCVRLLRRHLSADRTRGQARQPAASDRHEIPRTRWSHAGIFGYLLLVMTATNCLSHGTQDLYLLVWPGTARETPRLDQIPIPRRRHPERSEGSLYSPNAATAYKIAKPGSRTQTQRPSRLATAP
jgi:hypothetical protein